MKERGILFSAPMVRALLDGSKTQTRRVVKRAPPAGFDRGCSYSPGVWGWTNQPIPASEWHTVRCPYGAPGDRLWVREAWRVSARHDGLPPRDLKPRSMTVAFEAGGSIANQPSGRWEAEAWPRLGEDLPEWFGKRRPGMFLPRWASRITLEVVDVRVERLHAISEADAKAEGVTMPDGTPTPPEWWSYAQEYWHLWDRINGPDSGASNPWVWVVEFRRMEKET